MNVRGEIGKNYLLAKISDHTRSINNLVQSDKGKLSIGQCQDRAKQDGNQCIKPHL